MYFTDLNGSSEEKETASTETPKGQSENGSAAAQPETTPSTSESSSDDKESKIQLSNFEISTLNYLTF